MCNMSCQLLPHEITWPRPVAVSGGCLLPPWPGFQEPAPNLGLDVNSLQSRGPHFKEAMLAGNEGGLGGSAPAEVLVHLTWTCNPPQALFWCSFNAPKPTWSFRRFRLHLKKTPSDYELWASKAGRALPGPHKSSAVSSKSCAGDSTRSERPFDSCGRSMGSSWLAGSSGSV